MREKLQLQLAMACAAWVWPIMLKLEVSDAYRWDFFNWEHCLSGD